MAGQAIPRQPGLRQLGRQERSIRRLFFCQSLQWTGKILLLNFEITAKCEVPELQIQS
jgi:hypothetical protein